jgi:hypothetical protein
MPNVALLGDGAETFGWFDVCGVDDEHVLTGQELSTANVIVVDFVRDGFVKGFVLVDAVVLATTGATDAIGIVPKAIVKDDYGLGAGGFDVTPAEALFFIAA